VAHKHLQGLAVLNKPESMGLCFVGKRDMSSFLEGYLSLTPGRFVDLDTGVVVGQHRGKELFTVGQGARIAGAGDRYFVTFCEPGNAGSNQEPGDVFVVKGATHPKLFSRSLSLDASQVSWVAGAPPPGLDKNDAGIPLALSFKARYNQTLDPCKVHVQGDSLQVVFDLPSRAITPGQVCALYDGDIVLGAGIIRF
jgi:tRNA-specific 2-thiouridylase